MFKKPDYRPIADLSNYELQFYKKHMNVIKKYSNSIYRNIADLEYYGVYISQINIHEKIRLSDNSATVELRSLLPTHTNEKMKMNYFDFSITIELWRDEIGLMLIIPTELQEKKHDIIDR